MLLCCQVEEMTELNLEHLMQQLRVLPAVPLQEPDSSNNFSMCTVVGAHNITGKNLDVQISNFK